MNRIALNSVRNALGDSLRLTLSEDTSYWQRLTVRQVNGLCITYGEDIVSIGL